MNNENPFEDDSTFDDVNLLAGGVGSDAFADPSVQGQLMEDTSMMDDFVGSDQLSSTSYSASAVQGSIATPLAPSLSTSSSSSSSSSSQRGLNSKPKQEDDNVTAPGMCGCLSVNYYRPYFDVNTTDVMDRLKRVLMPWQADFFEILDGRPDFYGPFWICATLVFLISLTSNLLAWLHSDPDGEEPWQNFKVLSYGASFVFGFCVAMPFVAWACLSYLGVSTSGITFVEVACVYGYSIFTFLFASLLCMIPIEMIEWASVLLAFACSATFLVRNLWVRLGVNMENGGYMPPMETGQAESEQGLVEEKSGRKAAAILLAGVLGLHFVFAMVLKFKFFASSS